MPERHQQAPHHLRWIPQCSKHGPKAFQLQRCAIWVTSNNTCEFFACNLPSLLCLFGARFKNSRQCCVWFVHAIAEALAPGGHRVSNMNKPWIAMKYLWNAMKIFYRNCRQRHGLGQGSKGWSNFSDVKNFSHGLADIDSNSATVEETSEACDWNPKVGKSLQQFFPGKQGQPAWNGVFGAPGRIRHCWKFIRHSISCNERVACWSNQIWKTVCLSISDVWQKHIVAICCDLLLVFERPSLRQVRHPRAWLCLTGRSLAYVGNHAGRHGSAVQWTS